jgi:predicted  nucleic acid-binding Zn-ribbon protein
MTMDDLAKQLLREFSKLRAEVRDNGIVVEQMRDELRAVHEAVGDIQEQLADVPKRDEFDELRQEVRLIRAAVTATNEDVAGLKQRVDALEAA